MPARKQNLKAAMGLKKPAAAGSKKPAGKILKEINKKSKIAKAKGEQGQGRLQGS